jgi:septin 4
MEIDHDSHQVFVERMRIISDTDIQVLQPSNDTVTARLTAPIVTTYIDTDKISFER